MLGPLARYPCLLLCLLGVLDATRAAAAEVVFVEDFEAYAPGPLTEGAPGAVNRVWFTFDYAGRRGELVSGIRLEDGAGTDGSKALKLFAGLTSPSRGPFYVGVRRVLTADLGGMALDRLRLTADARVEIRDHRAGRLLALPQEFTFALRLESLRKHRFRGIRQFNCAGSGFFAPAGGLLSRAISGHRLEYGELRIAPGPAQYQIVLVVSSCFVGSRFLEGSVDLEISIDNVRLEIVEEESGAPRGATTAVGGAPPRCGLSWWPGNTVVHCQPY
jgi:hypothetical protein